eukprot:7443372-Pyramimonas_sp.AAC.1
MVEHNCGHLGFVECQQEEAERSAAEERELREQMAAHMKDFHGGRMISPGRCRVRNEKLLHVAQLTQVSQLVNSKAARLFLAEVERGKKETEESARQEARETERNFAGEM